MLENKSLCIELCIVCLLTDSLATKQWSVCQLPWKIRYHVYWNAVFHLSIHYNLSVFTSEDNVFTKLNNYIFNIMQFTILMPITCEQFQITSQFQLSVSKFILHWAFLKKLRNKVSTNHKPSISENHTVVKTDIKVWFRLTVIECNEYIKLISTDIILSWSFSPFSHYIKTADWWWNLLFYLFNNSVSGSYYIYIVSKEMMINE